MKVIINLLECSDSLEIQEILCDRDDNWGKISGEAKEQTFCFLLVLTLRLPASYGGNSHPFL